MSSAEPVPLQRWTRGHAAALLLGAAASLTLKTPIPACLVGASSLLLLIFLQRARWTTTGVFGSANAVTALRLVLVAILCALGVARGIGPIAALLVLSIFALDGLDGWLAKRSKRSTEFGAAFDMECDALLVLVCTQLLYLRDRLGAYILLPGLLRYVYALGIIFLPQRGGEAPPSRLGRYSFSLFASSMIASLWPLEPIHEPLAILATVLITWSFARSTLWYLTAPTPAGGGDHPPSS